MKRWILEGEWSGYVSRQRRVVHREVLHSLPEFRAWCEKTHAIRYTDGTTLVLSVRDAKPREKVLPLLAYTSLIRDCWRKNVTQVADLIERAKHCSKCGLGEGEWMACEEPDCGTLR
jgi:hypothetical protein